MIERELLSGLAATGPPLGGSGIGRQGAWGEGGIKRWQGKIAQNGLQKAWGGC